MTLNVGQAEALKQYEAFLQDTSINEFAISGPSGSGKSFLCKEMCSVPGHIPTLTATTNQAAAVLSAATGKRVQTIHSLLGLVMYDDYSTGKSVLKSSKKTTHQKGIIFIDESSFISKPLLEIIREYCEDAKLVFIGDKDQLAPVGEHTPSAFEGVETARLTEIMRRNHDHPISKLGDSFKEEVRGNKKAKMVYSDDVVSLDDDEWADAIIASFATEEMLGIPTDVRVLCWTNDQVIAYNQFIRGSLGYPADVLTTGEQVIAQKPVILNGKTLLCTSQEAVVSGVNHNTEIYHTVEVYQVMLGNTGKFVKTPSDPIAYTKAMKSFARRKNWTAYFDLKNNVADIRPAYASTIDKAQGSTHDVVFMDLGDISGCRESSRKARMMYVGVTRARDKVFTYGSL